MANASDPAPRSIISELTDRAVTKRTPGPDDPTTQEECPFFWELATTDLRSDGQRRFLPELTLVRVSGAWAVTLSDIESSQRKTFLVERLEDLARAAERALVDTNVPWVPFRNRKNPKGIDHDVKKST